MTAFLGDLAALTTALCWSFTSIFFILAGRPRAALDIIGDPFLGPFVGVSLSLLAIQLTQIGIASTLMALSPVFLLPISYYFFKEQINWRIVAGALAAISGVAILFLL